MVEEEINNVEGYSTRVLKQLFVETKVSIGNILPIAVNYGFSKMLKKLTRYCHSRICFMTQSFKENLEQRALTVNVKPSRICLPDDPVMW